MHIPWSEWLRNYGLWAVLIGTFLEGESILVAGAIAAQRGYMHIESVILAALIGSFTGDQLYFFLGRNYGRKWLNRWPTWHDRVARVLALLDRYHAAFILSFRFLYGLRSIAPFVLGTSGVSVAKFMPLNFLGALMWSVSVGGLGYMLGEFDFTAWLLNGGLLPWGILAGVLALVALLIRLRRRRQPASGLTAPGVDGQRAVDSGEAYTPDVPKEPGAPLSPAPHPTSKSPTTPKA